MKTIVVANTKGGTGKTTTCLNLATELGLAGKKVLLIDLDPQSSLSKTILTEQALPDYKGIEDLMSAREKEPGEIITQTKIKGVSIIPSHAELGEIALKLVMNASFYVLKDVIRKITSTGSATGGFDYLILDTQPSKNILMLNAFSAVTHVVIPTNPGVYPLMDIVELEETIKSTALNSNPNLQIAGVLVTMMQRATIYRQLENDLREYFGDKVFKATISRLVKSEESAVEGIGVSGLDPACKLALQYRAFTQELLHRLV